MKMEMPELEVVRFDCTDVMTASAEECKEEGCMTDACLGDDLN